MITSIMWSQSIVTLEVQIYYEKINQVRLLAKVSLDLFLLFFLQRNYQTLVATDRVGDALLLCLLETLVK